MSAKRDFRWYEVLSRAMLEIVKENSPLVEYYSIPNEPLSHMDLLADRLQYRGWEQRGLFDPPASLDRATTKLKLEVNARHGRFALRSAVTLPLGEIYQDEAHGYEVCDIHGKTCF